MVLLGFVLAAAVSAAKIATDAPCGIFVDGQQPAFRVSAPAGSTWTATDWRGRTIGKGPTADHVEPPAPDRGYYLLTVTDPTGVEARHSYFRVPDPATRTANSDSFYAIDSAFTGLGHKGRFDCPWLGGDTYKLAAELHRSAGLGHTRERMEWKRVQPKAETVPDFGVRLKNERLLRETGVSVSGLYQNAPKWAGARYSIAPDLLATYRFSEACARKFGDLVEDWEFDNEEDGGHTPEPAWEYAAAFKAASLGFHAGRRETLVLQGAFCQRKVTPYHEVMFRNDLGKYLDVFNYHCYLPLKDYEKVLSEFRVFLDKYDRPDREIWVTENGTDGEGHCEEASAMSGNKQHAPWQELVVAEFYPKAQALLQMAGVRRNFLFTLLAYNERGGVKDWGVMRRDGTLKPVYAAISTMTDELGDATVEGETEVGKDARGFLFRLPDGSETLLAWRVSDLDTSDLLVKDRTAPVKDYVLAVPPGDYPVVDLCGGRRTVRAEADGLKLTLDRYPAYVRGVRGLKVAKPAVKPGRKGPVSAEGEDLTVVLQVIHNSKDFAAASGQASLLIEKEAGEMTINVWNLSETPKAGRVTVEGATLRGLPETIELPAFGKVSVPVTFVNDDEHLAGSGETLMTLGGTFGEKKISRAAVKVVDTMRAVRNAVKVSLKADDPANWQRNTSADDFICERNAQEGGVVMKTAWKSSFSNRWLYPRYILQPGEDATHATVLEFEVRSKQDKVENDYSMSALMLGFDGTDEGDWLKFEHPREVWEKRRFFLSPVLKKNLGRKLTSFRIGGNPRGTKVDYFIRNVTLYVSESDSKAVVNPQGGGPAPDPFVTYDAKTGYYYLIHTANRGLDFSSDVVEIHRSRNAATLNEGEVKVICTTNAVDPVNPCIWAPEMHKAPDGKWYVWTSCRRDPDKDPKTIFVLQSRTEDPFDGFVYKGRPDPSMVAIDPTVTTFPDGRQYAVMSAYDYSEKGQWLEIRDLENPWTYGKGRAVIARPELVWERQPPSTKWPILEGPFFLRSPDGRRLFLVYSANGCFCEDYCLGVLEYLGGDPCRAEAWRKSPKPLFGKGNGVYAPGHASFFRSPDGTETWCAYHALEKPNPSGKPQLRYLHLQKVGFDATGYPQMDPPVPAGESRPAPSGER